MKSIMLITLACMLLFRPHPTVAVSREPRTDEPLASRSNIASTTQSANARLPEPGSITRDFWVGSFVGTLALIVWLAQLIRRAPEGYEDRRGFHFAKPQQTSQWRKARISYLQTKRRSQLSWLVPAARSLLSS